MSSLPDFLATFTYTSLDKGKRQIRLIRFQEYATVDEDGIRLSLETHDMSECPPYFALSYVWGIDAPRHEMVINDGVLLARNSLWLALSQLKTRQVDLKVKYFWIDAICINQDDILERGHQVNLMGDIYSHARFVVAWLGSETDDSHAAIKAISTYNLTTDKTEKDMLLAENSSHVVSLLQRSYFERMWIVQEFILAEEIIMICGSDSFRWDREMSNIVKAMTTKWLDKDEGTGVTVWLASERFNRKQTGYPMELYRLLVYFRSCRCSDLRDRVYALIGLLDPSHSRSWTADYTISREQLWCRVINSSLEESRTMFSYIALRLWEALELPLEDNSLELFRFVYWVIHFDELWNARNQMPDDVKRHHEENLLDQLDANTMYDKILRDFDSFPAIVGDTSWKLFRENLLKIMEWEHQHNSQCISSSEIVSSAHRTQPTLKKWREKVNPNSWALN
ncbi:heterokaryon incompatibility protein-domain-containing protein [Truncatella angustata]|uniref:Heterokaryon incompatibility protein-domain-containing protein n=1 Tax=Truncatella angustata TaxID=152316 RepID=A0A9P8RJB8_9PEZI|nr:heterokaryon incompatibility protein-domain-containing protein [Truncatella angustata]KAH6647088.1 heterokaryon incompatibility protein-domain-containing protein [Truncatella angustata]KAH8195869.1 hypothetical protein TruAng_009971 [Truncatella angustata]